METAFIINWWKNSEGGGVKTYYEKLIPRLLDANLKLNVLFRMGKDKLNLKLSKNSFAAFLEIIDFLKSKKTDVVILEGGFFFLIPVIIFKLISNQPLRIIYTFHTHINYEVPFYKKFIFNIISKKIDTLIFVSEGLRKNIKEVYPLNDIDYKIIPGGVSLPEYWNKNVLSADNSIKILLVGLTSMRSKYEGAKMVVDLIPHLVAEFPKVFFYFLGKGNYLKSLFNYAKQKKVLDYVSFEGYVDNVEDFYLNSHFLLHPSFGDGLPYSIMEAFSFGIPVLASNVGGIPEIVVEGYNGFLTENNKKDFLLKFKKLLLFENYLSLQFNARKTVKESFSQGIMSNRYIELIEDG